MKRSDYDTADGIQSHLESLDSLHAVLGARHDAYYERQQMLDEWCLLGRFALDTCGNTGKYFDDGYSSVVPAEAEPLIRDVVPADDLYRLLKPRKDQDKVSISVNLGNPNIPTSHVRCVECHEGWTVRTAHDAEGIWDKEKIWLGEFAGLTIEAVNEDLRASRLRDGIRSFVPTEWFVWTPDVTDDHGKEWRRVDADYIIQEIDRGEVSVHRFVHPKCAQERRQQQTRDQFDAIVEEAGFEEFELVPVQNTYDSESYHGSWFRLTTKNGKPIVMGRRKRVINIQWLTEDFRGDITGGDDVTKSDSNAHAWTVKKASEYLSRLRQALGA